MRDPAWLDELRQQLDRTKLPAAYVARLVEELSDHVNDCQEDSMSTDALGSQSIRDRLGAPAEIARRAGAEFRRRTFSGRHPILMFVALPLVTLFAVGFASVAGMLAAGALWKSYHPGMSTDDLSPWGVAGKGLICMLTLLVPATVTAALFAWLAARAGVQRKWPIVACLLLGLIAAVAQLDVYLSPLDGKSSLTLGLGFSTGFSLMLFQLAKLAVPLAVGIWIISRYLRDQTPTASPS